MRFQWINKNNNKELIVFFNGWGFDESVVSTIENRCFDILVFYDYQSFENFSLNFFNYEKKYLIAWSLGVYVCNFYYDNFKDFDSFTAINGTQKPIDNNFGIPVDYFNLTVDNFNNLTCRKFIKKINASSEIKRSIIELKNELIAIKNLNCKKFLPFNKAIISKKDKIFPYKNMLSFWLSKGIHIDEIDAPHYIFNIYKNWSDFI